MLVDQTDDSLLFSHTNAAKKTVRLTVLITIGAGTRRSLSTTATVTYTYKGNTFAVSFNPFGVNNICLGRACPRWGSHTFLFPLLQKYS